MNTISCYNVIFLPIFELIISTIFIADFINLTLEQKIIFYHQVAQLARHIPLVMTMICMVCLLVGWFSDCFGSLGG